jgi:hypothetical protein
VPTTHFAFRYIEFCKGENVVTGFPDGTYHPDDPVNRAQMAVFIARAIVAPAGDAGITAPTTPRFPDVTATSEFSFAFKQVQFISQPGREIALGFPDGLYHPEIVVSRDQMAVFIQRAFSLQ